MKKGNFLALILLMASCQNVFAWGKQGHEVVAQIAKSRLNQNTIVAIDKYLNGLTWEETATWMDDVKKGNEYNYLKEWHFVNVKKDATYVKTGEVNIINQLGFYLNVLKNRNSQKPESVSFALKIVFHLMADMAQPLHCGYEADRGGTLIQLKFLKKSSNLHKVWDSEIIERKNIDFNFCKNKLLSFTDTEMKAIQKSTLMDWFNDSRNRLKDVYDFQNATIDLNYINKNSTIISQQLIKSGIRLAGVLDRCFKV